MSTNTLKENLQDFITERLNQSYAQIVGNKSYSKIADQNFKLFTEIENAIQNTDITEKYKETQFDMYTMQLEEAYKIGFRDSAKVFLNKNL